MFSSLFARSSDHHADLRIPDIRCRVGIRILRHRRYRFGVESHVVRFGIRFPGSASENLRGGAIVHRGRYRHNFDDEGTLTILTRTGTVIGKRLSAYDNPFAASRRAVEGNLHIRTGLGDHHNSRMQRLRVFYSRQSTTDLHEVHTELQHQSGTHFHIC